jgi:class 3 adenylate cyclase
VTAAVLFLTPFRHLGSALAEAVVVAGVLLALWFSVVIYRRGYRPARFYILAFLISETGYIVFAFHSFGVLPTSEFIQHSLSMGSAWEMIALTTAVIDKIYLLRKEKSEAEREKTLLMLEQNILLENRVEERTRELEEANAKSEHLLLNILPEETAKELRLQGHSKARTFDSVTIMFADFKNFTALSEQVSAEDLISEIDACFGAFDDIMEQRGIEKIKTVGDSYLCASGLPTPSATHATDMVHAAIDIQRFMQQRESERFAQGLFSFEVRIGIHSGSVIAGIVGKKKFAYDIWSDSVNVAARMESSGEAGKINISDATHALVKDQFDCEYRGKIEAKHKGEIDMYFVVGESGERDVV